MTQEDKCLVEITDGKKKEIRQLSMDLSSIDSIQRVMKRRGNNKPKAMQKINFDTTKTCVQCAREMTKKVYVCTDTTKTIPICDYPDCPNYGLLQVGIEALKPND